MPRDDRTYIRVHDGMPDHPKVEPLSDAAFRLLVTIWCRSSEYTTDGAITPSWWAKQKARARRELMDAGLVEPGPAGGVVAHDYVEHQRTAAEIEGFKETKRRAGALGNHNRWHEGKRHDPACPICVANASQTNSHVR
jgi:hypothetical protein